MRRATIAPPATNRERSLRQTREGAIVLVSGLSERSSVKWSDRLHFGADSRAFA